MNENTTVQVTENINSNQAINDTLKVLGGAVAGFLLTIILLFGVGFTWPEAFQKVFPTQGVVAISQENTNQSTTTNTDYNREKELIIKLLKEGYIGDLPSEEEQRQGELKGLVASLGDKYSTYFTCKEYQSFQSDINQSFEGIGARFEDQGDKIVVSDILSGFPAEKAGLQKGDELLSVDGKNALDLGLSKSVEAIRGPANSKVTLVVNRPSASSTNPKLTFEITRAQIKEKTVTLTINQDVAIIKVSSFGADVGNLMSGIAKEIKSKPEIKKIILDLRDNGGGLLSQSVALASYFIEPDQVVVREKTKNGDDQLVSKQVDYPLRDYPLAILVNGSSASASEITAGALQDYKRGKLYGQKTYGKGVVQDLKDLTGCNKLKYTIAEWLTPNSREINGKGIAPDVVVNTKDDILQKAIDGLNNN
ncbi:MAG: hypothetical protein OHK0017_01600 [Patescibacteria group bacterium]